MSGYKTKYSIIWAREIVRKLFGAHSRATEFLLSTVGISSEQMAYLLADARLEFYFLREELRSFDKRCGLMSNWVFQTQKVQSRERMLSSLIKKARENSLGSFERYLTGRKKALDYTSQTKGRVRDAEAGLWSQPSGPNLISSDLAGQGVFDLDR